MNLEVFLKIEMLEPETRELNAAETEAVEGGRTGDGDVDGADYLRWQKGFGASATGSGLTKTGCGTLTLSGSNSY